MGSPCRRVLVDAVILSSLQRFIQNEQFGAVLVLIFVLHSSANRKDNGLHGEQREAEDRLRSPIAVSTRRVAGLKNGAGAFGTGGVQGPRPEPIATPVPQPVLRWVLRSVHDQPRLSAAGGYSR